MTVVTEPRLLASDQNYNLSCKYEVVTSK